MRRCTTWVHYKVESFCEKPFVFQQTNSHYVTKEHSRDSITTSMIITSFIPRTAWILGYNAIRPNARQNDKSKMTSVQIWPQRAHFSGYFVSFSARQPFLLKLSKISFHISIKWGLIRDAHNWMDTIWELRLCLLSKVTKHKALYNYWIGVCYK